MEAVLLLTAVAAPGTLAQTAARARRVLQEPTNQRVEVLRARHVLQEATSDIQAGRHAMYAQLTGTPLLWVRRLTRPAYSVPHIQIHPPEVQQPLIVLA